MKPRCKPESLVRRPKGERVTFVSRAAARYYKMSHSEHFIRNIKSIHTYVYVIIISGIIESYNSTTKLKNMHYGMVTVVNKPV